MRKEENRMDRISLLIQPRHGKREGTPFLPVLFYRQCFNPCSIMRGKKT